MRLRIVLALLLAALGAGALSACAGAPGAQLQIEEVKVGTGREARPGDYVFVNYSGFLPDGTEFDSSHKAGNPFGFPLGADFVIDGWDQGVAGMKVGGIRTLVIPPELAYGERGAGNVIPPNSTLKFDIELVDIQPGVEIHDLAVGDGATAEPGKWLTVHYSGWLQDGTLVDSSLERNEPFQFVLGGRQVIAGWEAGLAGMKVGGKRRLTIPPYLAYGAEGEAPTIPPNATLVFDIELLSVSNVQ
jgi:peptidylprolyl isomerase